MQTVVVAGGSGFIGFHLCQDLLAKGYRIICIDNLITSKKENITSLTANPNFIIKVHDITEQIIIDEPIHYIFHLASPASPNKKSPHSYINHPIETLLANSLGSYKLLELAKLHKEAYLYASSSEVYGDAAISVQNEQYFGNVNPIGIRSVYDEGKRFGEAITMAYVRTYDLNARCVRIFNTYGPRMQRDDGRVVSNFITQALSNENITVYGNGKQTRSLCYVSDMIIGIQRAMFASETKGQVINLGNPDERSVDQLALIIKQIVGSTSEIIYEQLPDDDPKVRKPDITRAKQLLHWQPVITLEEGLNKTIEYFRQQKE